LPLPLLQCASSIPVPSAVCYFSVCCLFSFFYAGEEGQSAQGSIQGWLGEYCVMLGVHLLVCRMSPKQVWRQHLALVGAILFTQFNVVWGSFLWARGSGCQSFDSPRCFISTKCGSSTSAKFLIHGAHAVCFCALVAILYSPLPRFESNINSTTSG
jgi:hypothetical protein